MRMEGLHMGRYVLPLKLERALCDLIQQSQKVFLAVYYVCTCIYVFVNYIACKNGRLV